MSDIVPLVYASVHTSSIRQLVLLLLPCALICSGELSWKTPGMTLGAQDAEKRPWWCQLSWARLGFQVFRLLVSPDQPWYAREAPDISGPRVSRWSIVQGKHSILTPRAVKLASPGEKLHTLP